MIRGRRTLRPVVLCPKLEQLGLTLERRLPSTALSCPKKYSDDLVRQVRGLAAEIIPASGELPLGLWSEISRRTGAPEGWCRLVALRRTRKDVTDASEAATPGIVRATMTVVVDASSP